VRQQGYPMGRRTALEVYPVDSGVENRSFGQPLTAAGDAPGVEAEIGKVSAGNHHQITVLSSQPAVIGRLFLTVEEAAQRLGVTVGWIYERTRRKTIPHRKLGKFVRFTEEDLRAIVEAAAKGTMQ
jgi:excisionase family DNA binding protein